MRLSSPCASKLLNEVSQIFIFHYWPFINLLDHLQCDRVTSDAQFTLLQLLSYLQSRERF